jgi:hypothetical protein
VTIHGLAIARLLIDGLSIDGLRCQSMVIEHCPLHFGYATSSREIAPIGSAIVNPQSTIPIDNLQSALSNRQPSIVTLQL